MWATSLGCGLLVERLLRVRLNNALLLPLGLCTALVLTFPGYAAGADDRLAIALLVAASVAGLALTRGGLRARLNSGWAGAAGLAVYLLYMLPVIAHGHWTWSGYNFVNDSSVEMLLATHIKAFGTAVGSIPQSSEREFLVAYFAASYPLGSQSLLGTFSGLTATEVPVLYQGFIAVLAAIGAVALATVTRPLLGARVAALIAAVAASANLTYQYALQGGIKELALFSTICATVALAREAFASLGSRPYIGAALIGIAAAASLAAYNAVAVPFLGGIVLILGLVLAGRARPTWRWAGPLAAGGAITAALSVPPLATFGAFFHFARTAQSSTGTGATQLGQLLRPLPLSQISGVFLGGDYRLPTMTIYGADRLTLIATVAILVLLAVGVLWTVRQRHVGALMFIGSMGLVMAIVFPRVSPYAQGKLLAIASPAVVLVALLPLASYARGRWRRFLGPPAVIVVGGLALAILASDLFAYSNDRIAPTQRMEAIRQVGEHFSGQGPVLWNEFDEFAKYFAREARVSVPFEALTPAQVQLRRPTPFFGRWFDLDEELFSFVEQYPIVVTRRSPAASRPPANYQLAYQNAYYLAWRRTARPAVLGHLPEQHLYSPAATVRCSALRSLVAHAPAGSRLIAAIPPELTSFAPLYSRDRSFGWGIDPPHPGAVVPSTAGHASGVLTVRGDARYTVWLQGDLPRPVEVQVDGRVVGSASGTNTPGQWFQVASLRLQPGPHAVRIVKPGGHRHLAPGESGIGIIGPVALQREEPERLQTLPSVRWRSLCGIRADWIELVQP